MSATTAPIRTVEENQPASPLPIQSYDYVPSVVIPLEKMVENLRILDEIRKKILRPGVDYDTIPGTDKPVLHKPGAERLLQFFGLGHRVECVDQREDWENGFFYYRFRVSIIKQYPGYSITVAECEGSANSKESRYRDRWVTEKKLKELGLSAIGLETRTKTGKYGDYLEYKIENPDPYTLVNTLQKMAIKRALVGATLQATATSGFFTQDLEDMDLPPSTDSKPNAKQGGRSTVKTGNGNSAPANKAKAAVINAMKEMQWSWDQLAEFASDALGRPIRRVLGEVGDAEWSKILAALRDGTVTDQHKDEPAGEGPEASYEGPLPEDDDLPF